MLAAPCRHGPPSCPSRPKATPSPHLPHLSSAVEVTSGSSTPLARIRTAPCAAWSCWLFARSGFPMSCVTVNLCVNLTGPRGAQTFAKHYSG